MIFDCHLVSSCCHPSYHHRHHFRRMVGVCNLSEEGFLLMIFDQQIWDVGEKRKEKREINTWKQGFILIRLLVGS